MNKIYKENFLKAGALAKLVRAFGKSLIVPGASYNDVIKQINEKITELGAIAAFPPQIALDNVAAHYLPDPDQDITFSNQLIKLDIGVCYNGAIGDCAVTVDLSGKYQKLIEATERALQEAEKIIKVDLPIRQIGQIIEQTIVSYGFNPIRNLSGHGVGYYKIHTSPSIPNCDVQTNARIRPGMTFAIEPFATDGYGLIYEVDKPTIFSFIQEKSLRSEQAKQMLAKIKTYQGLPFAMHDFVSNEMPLHTVKSTLKELMKAGCIAGYGPLLEQANGMVAQAENSVLVDEKGYVTISTR